MTAAAEKVLVFTKERENMQRTTTQKLKHLTTTVHQKKRNMLKLSKLLSLFSVIFHSLELCQLPVQPLKINFYNLFVH